MRKIVATLGPNELLGEFTLLDAKPALGCKILQRLAEDMSRSLTLDCDKVRALRRSNGSAVVLPNEAVGGS